MPESQIPSAAEIAAQVVRHLREKPIVEPALLTQQQAADFLAMSVGGLKNLVEAGVVTETRMDGKPRYWRQHLLSVIERRTG